MTVVAAINAADAGQIALIAAEKSDHSFPFKVVFNDAPANGTPSERYFVAYVMSAVEQLDEANNTMVVNTSLEIDGNIVKVSAIAGGAAPNNTVAPSITGTAEVGQTLTRVAGTWTGTPTPSVAVQWLADGESLSGQAGNTLTLTEEHEGAVITLLEIGSNHLGTVYAMSDPTSAVASD
jgi:hypothetical protein